MCVPLDQDVRLVSTSVLKSVYVVDQHDEVTSAANCGTGAPYVSRFDLLPVFFGVDIA